MIKVKTSQGLIDYCQAGIETNLVDMNGVTLKTGDVVEILNGIWFRAGIEDCRIDTGIVVFDQYENFLMNTKFYVEGWFSRDWANDQKWLIRKVDQSEHSLDSYYQIA